MLNLPPLRSDVVSFTSHSIQFGSINKWFGSMRTPKPWVRSCFIKHLAEVSRDMAAHFNGLPVDRAVLFGVHASEWVWVLLKQRIRNRNKMRFLSSADFDHDRSWFWDVLTDWRINNANVLHWSALFVLFKYWIALLVVVLKPSILPRNERLWERGLSV